MNRLIRQKKRVLLSMTLAAVAGIVSSCGGPEGGEPQNLLIISVDTLRPDRLGCYGCSRETSPTMDRLAEEGVRFADVTATSPWTLPSHVSLLTGLYPSRHGVRGDKLSLHPSTPSLTMKLNELGFQTKAIVNCDFLRPRYGLRAGFEDYEVFLESAWVDPKLAHMRNAGPTIVRKAIAWLEQRDDRPFFLFAHFYDVHSDYVPLPEYRREFVEPYGGQVTGSTQQLAEFRAQRANLSPRDIRYLRDLYDAEIRQFDDDLRVLMNYLERSGLSESTVVVLTADHGEEFMEHGSLLHGGTYYQEVISVPLIIKGPTVPRGLTVEDPVGLVDVAPTLLSLLSAGDLPGNEGFDLTAYFDPEGAKPEARTYFAEADHSNAQPDIRRMVRSKAAKLVYDQVTGEVELYDLESDPGEKQDRSDRDSAQRDALLGQLREFMRIDRRGREIVGPDDEERRRLIELGYVLEDEQEEQGAGGTGRKRDSQGGN